MKTLAPRRHRERQKLGRLLADVENLAEVVCSTIEKLDAEGLGKHARPLEQALQRLAG